MSKSGFLYSKTLKKKFRRPLGSMGGQGLSSQTTKENHFFCGSPTLIWKKYIVGHKRETWKFDNFFFFFFLQGFQKQKSRNFIKCQIGVVRRFFAHVFRIQFFFGLDQGESRSGFATLLLCSYEIQTVLN